MTNLKRFARMSGGIFILIALLHLARLARGWEAMIGGAAIPLWASAIALLVAGYLGYHGLKLAK